MDFELEEKTELLATDECYICGIRLNLTKEEMESNTSWISLTKDKKLLVHPYCKKYYVHGNTFLKRSSKKAKSLKKIELKKKETK